MLEVITAQLNLYPQAEVDRLLHKLASCTHVAITTHSNPDGDAMGSSLALALVLRKLGKTATVVVPNAFDQYLAWLPGTPDVIDATARAADANAAIAASQLVFCLDFSAMRRCGDVEPMVRAAGVEIALIDHHLDPEDFAQYNFHVAGLSSTAELVYRLFLQMGVGHLVDADVAANIYVGLMTDTGSFRFSTTTGEVHLIAAALLQTGIEVGKIHNLIYDNFGENRARFLGFMLYKKLKVLPEYRTAYMVISRSEGARFDLQPGDTEGLVNYCLSLKGINFGVLMKASERGTKLSFRSIGQFPCNEFAAHFGGGGHYNASGGKVDLNVIDTEAKFLEHLKDYKDALNY